MKTSLKKNEGYVYLIILDKRKKVKPKFQVNDLNRTADLKETFSKSEMTSWSYNLYKITEVINDPNPSYRIDILPERYRKASLKKKELSLKENKDVLKKLNITQIKSK